MRHIMRGVKQIANVSVKQLSEAKTARQHHIRSVKEDPKMTPGTGPETGDGLVKDSIGGVPAGIRTRNLLLRSY